MQRMRREKRSAYLWYNVFTMAVVVRCANHNFMRVSLGVSFPLCLVCCIRFWSTLFRVECTENAGNSSDSNKNPNPARTRKEHFEFNYQRLKLLNWYLVLKRYKTHTRTDTKLGDAFWLIYITEKTTEKQMLGTHSPKEKYMDETWLRINIIQHAQIFSFFGFFFVNVCVCWVLFCFSPHFLSPTVIIITAHR